uniref:Uncharacterized protein n=1 Tax=Nelumbo nucifera TaxID=4432 RepID=A0A822ZBU4_NELNU|nr:TPA_asm: hypothetical protein HUJ06_013331 [Nelumbo nucifera]
MRSGGKERRRKNDVGEAGEVGGKDRKE